MEQEIIKEKSKYGIIFRRSDYELIKKDIGGNADLESVVMGAIDQIDHYLNLIGTSNTMEGDLEDKYWFHILKALIRDSRTRMMKVIDFINSSIGNIHFDLDIFTDENSYYSTSLDYGNVLAMSIRPVNGKAPAIETGLPDDEGLDDRDES